MTQAEIIKAARKAVLQEGYKLIVLQSGEDLAFSDEALLDIIRKIKKELKVFVFISVGNRSKNFYKKAFKAGATGSLFRFETSNKALYEKLHPDERFEDRIELLKSQIKLGYYVATGNLIGVPGQTVSNLADDILMIKKLGVPMISAGPWLPAIGTPLSKDLNSKFLNSNFKKEQMELALKFIAVSRFVMPEIKIPVTTALETLDPENGRHRALLSGANALMFNLTPERYCKEYRIYDNKYRDREKIWQKYGLFRGEESWEMLEERLMLK